jgi:hypothetical protein
MERFGFPLQLFHCCMHYNRLHDTRNRHSVHIVQRDSNTQFQSDIAYSYRFKKHVFNKWRRQSTGLWRSPVFSKSSVKICSQRSKSSVMSQ